MLYNMGFETMEIVINNGKTRRSSGRNDPRSTGGHPKLSTGKKGDSK
jgi:hypothetical protein